MGTKKIQTALARLNVLACGNESMTGDGQILVDAMCELEAIRKAAKDYVECLSGTSANSHQRPETRERQVRPLLESIAKEVL